MSTHASHLRPASGRIAARVAAVSAAHGTWAPSTYAPRPFAKTVAGNGRSRRTEEPLR